MIGGRETAENLFWDFGCRGKGFFAKVSVYRRGKRNQRHRPGSWKGGDIQGLVQTGRDKSIQQGPVPHGDDRPDRGAPGT